MKRRRARLKKKLKQGAKEVIAKLRDLEQRAFDIERDHRKLIMTVITLCAAIIAANVIALFR
jgi:type IV secretory pathway component VirB8